MAADLTRPFAESCCEGGACNNDMSTQYCGCDKGAGWVCERHINRETEFPYIAAYHNPSHTEIYKVEPKIVTIADMKLSVDVSEMLQRENLMRDTVPAVGFIVKDSGKREQFAGGMVRDTADGKIDYGLVRDGPMYERWAEHLRKGAAKYGKGNWLKGRGQEELDRARESAIRHFEQWYRGDTDEDHASAVFFNINQTERLKQLLAVQNKTP